MKRRGKVAVCLFTFSSPAIFSRSSSSPSQSAVPFMPQERRRREKENLTTSFSVVTFELNDVFSFLRLSISLCNDFNSAGRASSSQKAHPTRLIAVTIARVQHLLKVILDRRLLLRGRALGARALLGARRPRSF